MGKTLGERLNEALSVHAPDGVRSDKSAFQEAIKRAMRERMGSGEGRQGTSYPAVLGYFSGENTPSLPWVEEAATILGVRKEWLAFGDEPPTRAEQLRRQPDAWQRMVKVLYEELGLSGPVPDPLPPWAGTLVEVWAQTGSDEGIAIAIRGTLQAFNVRYTDLDQRRLGEFVSAMVPAFLTIARWLEEDVARTQEWVTQQSEDTEEEETDGES